MMKNQRFAIVLCATTCIPHVGRDGIGLCIYATPEGFHHSNTVIAAFVSKIPGIFECERLAHQALGRRS